MSNKDAYYFSHDANAITDPKILAMRCDYGMEGYGLYWAIIEMMRNEECYKLNYEKNTFRAIKSLTNTNIDVDKFVDDCVNDYELFKLENNKLFSNSLLRRMEEYDHKKAISRENGKKGGAPKGNQNAKKSKEDKTETTQNNQQVDFEQTETTKNNQSKVKESKEKESKKNNININKIKLNSLYLYLTGKAEKFEGLTETDRGSIQTTLKKLDLYIERDDNLPEQMKFDLQLKYYAITQIYLSPYKIYLLDIKEKSFTKTFLAANQYCPIETKTPKQITDFMNYFIVCLRKEFEKK